MRRVFQCTAVLGKCRRVEYDQVIVVGHVAEELEGIFGKKLCDAFRWGS